MLFKALFILLCFVVIFGCLDAAPNKQKQLLNSSPSSPESEQFNHHDKGHKKHGVVKQNVENKNKKQMGWLFNEKKPAHNSGQTSRQRQSTSSSKPLTSTENEQHIGTSNRQSVMHTNRQTKHRAEQQRSSAEVLAHILLAERSGANRPTERHASRPAEPSASPSTERQRPTTQRSANGLVKSGRPTERSANDPVKSGRSTERPANGPVKSGRQTERSANGPVESRRSTERPANGLAERQRPTTQCSANGPVESRHSTERPANAEPSGASRPNERQRQTTQRHKNCEAERRRPTEANDECTVCFESLLEPARALKTLQNCKHSFHQKCIDEWLKNIKNDSCPLCREKVLKEELPRNRSDPDQVQRNGNPNTIIDELPLEIVLELVQEQEAGGLLPLQIPSHIVETILREHRNNLPSTSNVQEIQRQHRNNLPSTSNAASRGNGAWEPYEHLLNGTSELHFSEEQNIHRPNYNEQNNEDFGPAFSTRNEEWESHEHLLNGTSELHFSEEQNIHPPNYNGQNLTDLARDIGVTAVGGLARGLTTFGNSLNDWLNGNENSQQASTLQTADGIIAYHDGSPSQSSIPPDQPQPGDIVRLRDQNGRVHTAHILPNQQH